VEQFCGGQVEIVPRGTILAVGWIFDGINESRVGAVLLVE
jgi:hypothetical protein